MIPNLKVPITDHRPILVRFETRTLNFGFLYRKGYTWLAQKVSHWISQWWNVFIDEQHNFNNLYSWKGWITVSYRRYHIRSVIAKDDRFFAWFMTAVIFWVNLTHRTSIISPLIKASQGTSAGLILVFIAIHIISLVGMSIFQYTYLAAFQ